jgi:hypothetical protein
VSTPPPADQPPAPGPQTRQAGLSSHGEQGGAFAEARRALLEALERAELEVNARTTGMLREGEERTRRVVAQAVLCAIDLDAQLGQVSAQLKQARVGVAEIRERLLMALRALSAEESGKDTSAYDEEDEAFLQAALAEARQRTNRAAAGPQREPAAAEQKSASEAASGEAEEERPAALALQVARTSAAPPDTSSASTQDTVRALRAALDALNRTVESERR